MNDFVCEHAVFLSTPSFGHALMGNLGMILESNYSSLTETSKRYN